MVTENQTKNTHYNLRPHAWVNIYYFGYDITEKNYKSLTKEGKGESLRNTLDR